MVFENVIPLPLRFISKNTMSINIDIIDIFRKVSINIDTKKKSSIFPSLMVDGSWSGYYVSPHIRTLSEAHTDVHCLDGVSNNQPVLDIFSWCGCEVDHEDKDLSLYSPRCWMVSSVSKSCPHIKDSSTHDLTSMFLLSYFFRSWHA